VSRSGAATEALAKARRAYEERRYADAARLYAAVVADSGPSPGAFLGLGDARWKRGDRDGAIEAYEAATREAPDLGRAWHNLATALLAARRPQAAAEAAERAVELEPGRAKAWNNLGAARHALGEDQRAEEAFLEAVRLDPALAAAWENLGWLRIETGRCADAEDAFRRAKNGDADPSLDRGLARCLAEKGDLAAAEGLLAEAVRASPSRADLWLDLAELRRRLDRLGPALDAYEGAASAVAEMGEAARASVARPARATALALAREASAEGDRRALVAALDRARAAADAAALGDDPETRAAVDAVVAAAGSRKDLPPSEVSTLVRSRLRAPGAPGGREG
jgi:tetratricopeptide (TPR) repeat protein